MLLHKISSELAGKGHSVLVSGRQTCSTPVKVITDSELNVITDSEMNACDAKTDVVFHIRV